MNTDEVCIRRTAAYAEDTRNHEWVARCTFYELVLGAIALTDGVQRPAGQNACELAAAALGR